MSRSLRERSLYLCTPLREDLERFVGACIEGGVDVVQLRERDRGDRTVLAAAERLLALCHSFDVPFVVNDRCDLAQMVGADGVHVGQDDLPADRCRALLGDDAVVGLSTHADDELEAALSMGVTYLSAGPVVETPTKPGRPGTGLDYVERAVARSPVPVFVTGGVSPSSVPTLVARGVRHFVVVRALTEAPDPRRAASALSSAIRDAVSAAEG